MHNACWMGTPIYHVGPMAESINWLLTGKCQNWIKSIISLGIFTLLCSPPPPPSLPLPLPFPTPLTFSLPPQPALPHLLRKTRFNGPINLPSILRGSIAGSKTQDPASALLFFSPIRRAYLLHRPFGFLLPTFTHTHIFKDRQEILIVRFRGEGISSLKFHQQILLVWRVTNACYHLQVLMLATHSRWKWCFFKAPPPLIFTFIAVHSRLKLNQAKFETDPWSILAWIRFTTHKDGSKPNSDLMPGRID